MATDAPDPRTFKSWEDAFQFPIPVVRKLESQLRSNAGENREKLRSLVGASYRDLLNTAETIIDMEVQMQHVESKLAKVGQRCNSRGVDRISSNATRMENHQRSKDTERYTFASQLSVLRNCPSVINRLIKSEGSLLLAAKVLVISRLLLRALSSSTQKPPFLDQIQDRLSILRQKLLNRINKQLSNPAADTSLVIQSMCAHSLATSSTPTDVLNHFHRVRMKEIEHLLNQKSKFSQNGIRALKLCIQTCQDTQTIFPRKLADSLAKLKSQPLVQDADIIGLFELNLDIHERWIGGEARNYTPYPRHDELQRPAAEKILNTWSKQAVSAFLSGIKNLLSKTKDLQQVASLRQEIIETWILSGSRVPGIKSANVLDDLRDAMNTQLENIVQSRAQDLQKVVSELSQLLGTWSTGGGDTSLSLWSPASTSLELADGAEAFKSTILNTHQGRDDAVIRIVEAFDSWSRSVLEVKGIIKLMREARWDDTFAEDADDSDDDLEDSKQTLLSSDDPVLLEEATHVALNDVLKSLQKSLTHIVGGLNTTKQELYIPQVMFMLRVLREIGDRISGLRLQDNKTTPTFPSFPPSLLEPLHLALTSHVVDPAIVSYEKSLATIRGSHRSKSNILWEGNPPLPAQPSPTAFRFLQTLTKRMSACGGDIWAPHAVKAVKTGSNAEVQKVWRKHFDLVKEAKVNGFAQDEPVKEGVNGDAEEDVEERTEEAHGEEIRAEKLKQLLFDVLYIQHSFHVLEGPSEESTLVKDIDEFLSLDESAVKRLRKSASDYGKKTYLLFALLL